MTTPRYDMPIAFGPSSVPDHTDVPHAYVAIVSFLTDEAPLAAWLPPGFTLVLGTVQINGVPAPNPLGGLGPLLAFNLGVEAGQIGFATRVCEDPHAEAMAVAREIAGKSPDAIRAGKRIFNDAPYSDPANGFLQETVEQVALIGSANQVEAVMANLQKRAPTFAD